ncbi:MAG: pseudouridine synthase [Phycisphaerae bacterium]
MRERIQKILAAAGVDSRRNIEQMVLDGRVSVNGKVVRRLPVLVDLDVDAVEVDGEAFRLPKRRHARRSDTDVYEGRVYLVMNKPRGYVTTAVPQGVQKTVIDLLPPDFPVRVFPVGRLDAESKGLLILTNDGDLTNQLTHPRYGVAKTYRAKVDGRFGGEASEQLQQGQWLADPVRGGYRTKGARLRVLRRTREASTLEIELKEGRNRQIRRVLAKLGHKVRDLVRIRMGPLELGKMKLGEVRVLKPAEVTALRNAVARQATVKPKPSAGPKKPK